MIISANRAIEKISAGTIAPGYLLLGREVYWRDRIWFALRRGLGLEDSSISLSEVDLRHCSLDALLAQAEERDLWSPRRMLLVRNAHTVSGVNQLEKLGQYFRYPNPDSVLVFEMTDVALDSDDWRDREKVKARQEHWENLCEVVLLASPSRKESLAVIRQESAERGCKITSEAAENLVAFSDSDLGRMVMELDKLCLYRAAGEITAADVELLAGDQAPSQGLTLQQAVGRGDPGAIFVAFENLIPKGAYLPLVLSELTRYLRQLLLLQERRGGDARAASRILWGAHLPAPQSLLPELARQARLLPRGHLARCLQGALRAERALRSSPADDRLIIERFLLDIAGPLRPQVCTNPRAKTAPLQHPLR